MDQINALLKRAMPFQMVGPDVLMSIAGLAKWESHAKGDVIYQVDDEADDIYLVSSGSVQHTLRGNNGADALERTMHSGEVFGWAALLDHQPQRIAKAACLEDSAMLRLSGEQTLQILASDPVSGYSVMRKLSGLITRQMTLPVGK